MKPFLAISRTIFSIIFLQGRCGNGRETALPYLPRPQWAGEMEQCAERNFGNWYPKAALVKLLHLKSNKNCKNTYIWAESHLTHFSRCSTCGLNVCAVQKRPLTNGSNHRWWMITMISSGSNSNNSKEKNAILDCSHWVGGWSCLWSSQKFKLLPLPLMAL